MSAGTTDRGDKDRDAHAFTGHPVVSVVVPVYNEAASIEAVLRALESSLASAHETLVVYDFEEDNTVPVVARLLRELPSVQLVRNELGPGALNAIRAGMAAAKGTYVVVTMADGSDEPTVIEAMLAKAQSGAAVVAASRYVHGGAQIGGPRLKALASRSAGLILHYVGGLAVHDPTSNFKCYSRAFLESVEIESSRGFELALELTVKARAAGLPLAEVPTTWHDRTAGESRWVARELLPGYLRWFFLGLSYRLPRPVRELLVAPRRQTLPVKTEPSTSD